MKQSMAMSFAFWVLPLLFSFSASGHEEHTKKTMEDFSGYPREFMGDSFVSESGDDFFVDVESLQRQIDELSTFSDTPPPTVTRVLFSKNDVLARKYIKNIMGQLGLSIREDAVGNIFAKWEGSEADLPSVATGSHIDAIPYSGKYDGVVGVLGALRAISVLKRSGFHPRRSLEVIMFTSEEPTRFGISCLGSRLLAGSELLAEALKQTVDSQNVSFFDAAKSAGYGNEQEGLKTVFLKKGHYFAFLELHIEQGPILEEEGIPIGIVTAIAAPASIKVDFEGGGGHAGAVLMPARNDAGLAAAELALAVERHVLDSGSVDTVGTVGILELHPGAINSIPSRSHVEIDTRDIDEKRRNCIVSAIHQSAVEIAERRKVKLSSFKIVNQDPPASADELVVNAMEKVSQTLNLTHKFMISRAYHDSLFMARISRMGMIFIPCFKATSPRSTPPLLILPMGSRCWR
ncbi:ureidoglycolate amidohydrolase isoform X2 [Wolffia australiana]